MQNGETLTLRSIHVSSFPDHGDSESPSGVAYTNAVEVPANGDLVDVTDNDEIKDAITLPQSTHSLLFTEPVFSLPFGFGFVVLIITSWSLSFALIDALQPGGPGNQFNIPADVTFIVRGAQYLSILIALLMEEEIPTGLYLLRMIPRKSFEGKFPGKKYRNFVCSSVLRVGLGYLFLMNVFLVLIQATGVLQIFYDVMALQFVQQLDDISFRLAKMDMLGKSISRATTAKCYRAEFQKQKRRKKMGILLKVIYFLNLGVFLAAMTIISTRQNAGYYQCNSITVDFGDDVCENAVVKTHSGQLEDGWTLVYSHFNGVYVQDGKHHGRPIYREMRKYNYSPYKTTIAAEIKFCRKERAWIFTHENIRKSKDPAESDCGSWLLRSPESAGYDLLSIDGGWDVWVGIIGKTSVSIVCNQCHEDSDCNFEGQCINGECKCYSGNGVQYFGRLCEISLRDSCRTIIGEGLNDTWSVAYVPSPNDSGSRGTLLQEYSRPVYSHVQGIPDLPEGDRLSLVYSGRRWFGVYLEDSKNLPFDEWIRQTKEYHAFWDHIFSTNALLVSDPTTSSTPVGVDFYFIGEHGGQFGVFGELIPLQLYNQTGRGVYRCSGSDSTPRNNNTTSDRRLKLKRVFTHRQLGKLGG